MASGFTCPQAAFASLLHVRRSSGLWEVKNRQTCCLWSRSPQQSAARFAHPPASILWLGKPRLRGERTASSQPTLILYLKFSFSIAAVSVGFQVPADQYHSHFFTGDVNSQMTFHR